MGWHEAYEKLREFCRRLGGELSSLVEIGLERPGEKLFSVSCIVPRRLSNDKLAEAIHELAIGDVKRDLSEVLDTLGEFEIEEETASKRSTKLSMFSGIITVYGESEKWFDIPASRIEYVYPDAIEDYLENREARLTVKAKGSNWALKEKGEARAHAWGHLTLYTPEELRKDEIRRFLDELDKMLSDNLRNPENFFKLRK